MKFFLSDKLRGLSCAAMLVAAFVVAGSGLTEAQSYPTKSIRLILPYPPGGANDTVARILAPKLSEILGRPVTVENMPGANGAVAHNYLAKAPPDGHQLVITTASPLVTNPHAFANITYDPLKDFTYITTVAETETLLVVNPSLPANNFEELVALAKTRELRFSIPGLGGQPQLIIEKIKLATGARIVTVPYTGSAAVNDVVAGHVDGTVFDMPMLISLINENRLRGIAILSKKPKSDFLPSIPSFGTDEKYNGFIFRSWIMLLAPAGIPKDVAQKLRDSMAEAMKDPAIVAKLRTVALTPLLSSSPEAAASFIRDEYEHFRKLVKETGVKVQN